MKKLNLCAISDTAEMFMEEINQKRFKQDFSSYYEEGMHKEVNNDTINQVLDKELDEMKEHIGEDYFNEDLVNEFKKKIKELNVKKLVGWGIEYDMNITIEYE